MRVVTFFWLNFHLPYACRQSGMCCTSGWPIPVERARVPLIQRAIAADTIPLRVVSWLSAEEGAPDEVAGTLALRENGHCVFFEAGRPGCAIHGVKPSACVHFPYVCLIDPRGVRVNLSHFCPTSTALLFEHRGGMLRRALRASTSPKGEVMTQASAISTAARAWSVVVS